MCLYVCVCVCMSVSVCLCAVCVCLCVCSVCVYAQVDFILIQRETASFCAFCAVEEGAEFCMKMFQQYSVHALGLRTCSACGIPLDISGPDPDVGQALVVSTNVLRGLNQCQIKFDSAPQSTPWKTRRLSPRGTPAKHAATWTHCTSSVSR